MPWLLALACMPPLAGCGTAEQTRPASIPAAAPQGPRAIIRTPSPAPGDALVVEVVPRSTGTRLMAEDLEFWLLESGQGARRIWPVTPAESAQVVPPAPGARQFVFTRATSRAGECRLVVGYRGVPDAGTAWSEPVEIEIAGQMSIERDGLGLITRAEAERIARAHANMSSDEPCASALVTSPVGLQVWDVRMANQNESVRRVLVNPYLGTVHTSLLTEEEKERG